MKQQIKRIFSGVLALLLCVGLFAMPARADEARSGNCGENVTWVLENGTLTISGSGAMADYSEWEPAPWYDFRDLIQQVKVSDGVTSVGKMAFYQCEKLTMVTLSASVKVLRDLAFNECRALSRIVMPEVEEIGRACFYSCESLINVQLPEGLRIIGNKAFYNCKRLAGITVPISVEELGESAFCYCSNLVYAEIKANLTILPYWTFYGCRQLRQLSLPETIEEVENNALGECDSLYDVSYGGSEEVKEDIQEQLDQEGVLPDEQDYTYVDYTETEGAVITTTTETKETGDPEEPEISYETTIEATITDSTGWSDLVEEVKETTEEIGYAPKVEVVVMDQVGMDQGALNDLAESEAIVNIHTSDNVSWEVVLEHQTTETLETTQSFTVAIMRNIEPVYTNILGDAVSYTVTLGSTGLNTTVLLPLGRETARQVATLFAIRGKKLEKLTSVVVDDDGRAAFALAGTAPGDYILALNVQGIDSDEVTIPKKLASQYGVDYSQSTLTDMYGNMYVITGTTNSLGFGIGTLTLIVFGVLIGSAVVVGVVMMTMNKKQQQKQRIRRPRDNAGKGPSEQ